MFAQPVKTNVALERKMKRLQRHADMIEALAIFLSKHPGIAEWCELKPLEGKMGLDFDDRGLIAPMGKDKIVLRLSRYSRLLKRRMLIRWFAMM